MPGDTLVNAAGNMATKCIYLFPDTFARNKRIHTLLTAEVECL